MTDPIADMLTRIRNASAVKKPEVMIPFSKVKFNIVEILKNEGYIDNIEVREERKDRKQLIIKLKYNKEGNSVITGIKRISKPGRRLYTGKNELPRVLNNLGIAIISTSRGLMTNKQAKKEGVGGEIICELY